MMDRRVGYVVQIESAAKGDDPDRPVWLDMIEHRARDVAEEDYLSHVEQYGATRKVQLIERVTVDTTVRRNYL